MDYFGEIVDELTELQERIESSNHAEDAIPVLKALRRAMYAALCVERKRNKIAAESSIKKFEPSDSPTRNDAGLEQAA